MEKTGRVSALAPVHEDRPGEGRKVTHVTTVHQALDARIFHREAVSLANLGYEVTVFGLHPEDTEVSGVRVRAVSMPRRRVLRLPMSFLEGIRIFAGHRSDLWHFHDPELIPVALLGKLLGLRCVYDAHEDVTLILVKDWLPRWARRPLAWAVDRIDRFAARRMDAVVTVTDPLKARYAGLARHAEIFFNYPPAGFLRGVEQSWLPWSARRNEIIHVGSLRMERLGFLVRVLSTFLRGHPDWQASLIGLSEAQLRWFDAHRDDALQARLIAEGKRPYQDVGAWLCAARIGLNFHPLDAPHIRVAIPVKVFEYLACGLPTLTTAVPELLGQVKDCPAVVVGRESEAEYLTALEALVARTDLDSLSDSARRFSRARFNCEVEGRRLSDLYEDILSSGDSAGSRRGRRGA